jgi:H+/Cl- antiporter ClcA
VVQTPLTGFIIVMEMTDNHSLLLPLMATAFIAYGVSRVVCPIPIYEALAKAFLLPPAKPHDQDTEDKTGNIAEKRTTREPTFPVDDKKA